MSTTERVDHEDEAASGYPLPEYVDWIAAAAIALGGIAFAVGGWVLTAAMNRDAVAEGIESGEITMGALEQELTQAEMVDLIVEVAFWSGVGLAVTGVGMVVFAVGYAVSRHRTHQRTPEGESAGSYRAHAVIGAVITTVFSFVPFSQLLGGGVAGYIEHHETGRSTSVGAVSGLLSIIPLLSVLVFVSVGLVSGFAAAQVDGMTGVALVAVFLGALFTVVYAVGVSAIGGFVGGWIAGE